MFLEWENSILNISVFPKLFIYKFIPIQNQKETFFSKQGKLFYSLPVSPDK